MKTLITSILTKICKLKTSRFLPKSINFKYHLFEISRFLVENEDCLMQLLDSIIDVIDLI